MMSSVASTHEFSGPAVDALAATAIASKENRKTDTMALISIDVCKCAKNKNGSGSG